MADTQNFVVSMPSSLFTAARSFKALANGKIYLGQPDTDPTIPSNQIQVYVSNEDGTLVPVPQPMIINAGGHPVYSGQIVKFVTLQSHSMAIYDAYGSLEYYFHDVSQYDASYFIAYATENFEPAKYKRIAGSFSIGATITNKMDVLIYGGDYYQWTGALPKTVAAGSTPTESGWKLVGPALESRRADRYDSIQEVLNTGMDVTIGEDSSLTDSLVMATNQQINGSGGQIIAVDGITYGIYIDAQRKNADAAVVTNAKMKGSITSAGLPGYSVLIRDTKNAVVENLFSDGFTGGLEVNNSEKTQIRGVRATNTVYHPSRTAGGYAVVLGNNRDTLIDGIQFNAGSGNNGRHMLYVSRYDVTDGSYDGCENTLAANMIAKYKDKDDRNFPGIVHRKSNRTLIENFIIDGANGGVAYNTQNGNILNNVVGSGIINVFKYSDGVTVYGLGQNTTDPYVNNGFLYHDLMVEVMPKVQDGSLNYQDCTAFNILGKNGMVTNCVTKVARSGRPIFVGTGANNVLINGVLDYIDDSGTSAITPMITFNGVCSGITVKGVVTSRPMFSGTDNVTDLTVDFARKATVRSTTGTITTTDANSLISSTSADTNAITIVFKSHVTQAALNNAIVNTTGSFLPPQTNVIMTRGSKTLTVRTYNNSGTIINPSTTSLEFEITLFQ